MSRIALLLTPFLVVLALAPTPAASAGHLPCVASIPPVAHFVEEVGGENVEVTTMVPPGANPATYEPTPRQMARLAEAELYFAVGVPFERVWLDRMAAQNPSMTIVRTQDNVIKRAMQSHRHLDEPHEHGQEARDADEDGRILDPHIWLDPKRASQMAENIRDALIQADPEHESLYKMNAARLMAEMSTLDAHIRDLFADLAEDPDETQPTFMVFHPAWGYFADAYGLEQAPIELEGKEPSPAELGKLVERAKKRGVSAIFVQPQFSDQSARLIAGQIGAEVVKLDPMARDWADNLRSAARAIHDAVIEKD